MKAKVGEKVLTVCKKHNNAIVYHNLDIGCPLCIAQETIMELEGEYDALRGEHENATFGAPGSY